MPSCLIPQRRYNVRSHADLYQDQARGVAIDITRVVHCWPGLSQRMRQRDVTCHSNFVLVMKPPVYLNPMFVKYWLSITVKRARVRLNTVCLDAGISLGILPEISLSWAVMAAIGLVCQIPRLYRSTYSPASHHLVCQPSHSCSFGSGTKRNPSRVCISFSLCVTMLTTRLPPGLRHQANYFSPTWTMHQQQEHVTQTMPFCFFLSSSNVQPK